MRYASLLVLLLTACAADVGGKLPANAKLSCADGGRCPDGMLCDPATAMCWQPGAGMRGNGESCDENTDCTSAQCVGGICCAESCVDAGSESCGTTGQCDGDEASATFGQCAFYAAGTACRGEQCSAGEYTAAQGCAGDGSPCPDGTAEPCPGGAACQDGSKCVTACTIGSQVGCPSDTWCRSVGGAPACVAHAQQDGDPCLSASDCAGNHCDHGLCCASGTCCNGTTANCPPSSSSCLNVATCAGEAHTYSCPTSGTNAFSCVDAVSVSTTACDGSTCRGTACASGQLTPPQQCAGGVCPAGTSNPCPGGNACLNLTTCFGSCELGTQNGCTAGTWCRWYAGGPACRSNEQQPGDPCAVGTDCQGSNHCDHNICCASGTCCDGTLANCPSNSNVCTNQSTCTGTSTTYSCTAHSCAASVSSSTVCNGSIAAGCNFFKDAICPNITCLSNCTLDGDCDATAWCKTPGATGQCVDKYVAGTSCTGNIQCKSGLTCGGTSPTTCPSPFTCGTKAMVCCSGARCCTSSPTTQCGHYYTCDTPTACNGSGHIAACSNYVCDFTAPTTNGDDYGCTSSSTASCGHYLDRACNGGADQSGICPTACVGQVMQFCGSPPLPCGTACETLGNCKSGYLCNGNLTTCTGGCTVFHLP
jgi:hypothetical protein